MSDIFEQVERELNRPRDRMRFIIVACLVALAMLMCVGFMTWWKNTFYIDYETATYQLQQRGYTEIQIGGENPHQCYTYRNARLSREFEATSIEGYVTKGVLCGDYWQRAFEVKITAQRK